MFVPFSPSTIALCWRARSALTATQRPDSNRDPGLTELFALVQRRAWIELPGQRYLLRPRSVDRPTLPRYTPLERKAASMFVAVRAITYATLFIALLLIYLPARVLFWSGVSRPAAIDAPQITGMIVGAMGAAIALWCIFTFVWVGKGTPAPFDAPRRLVIRGPYRYVRNPMYIGATLALCGAALFYRSGALLAYGAAFILTCHLFVIVYEEPTLRRTFGPEYEAYCHRVRRWWPVTRTAR